MEILAMILGLIAALAGSYGLRRVVPGNRIMSRWDSAQKKRAELMGELKILGGRLGEGSKLGDADVLFGGASQACMILLARAKRNRDLARRLLTTGEWASGDQLVKAQRALEAARLDLDELYDHSHEVV